ncbi:hypothetical protein FRC10_002601, partial [Ceratobasidium sp. 414]
MAQSQGVVAGFELSVRIQRGLIHHHAPSQTPGPQDEAPSGQLLSDSGGHPTDFANFTMPELRPSFLLDAVSRSALNASPVRRHLLWNLMDNPRIAELERAMDSEVAKMAIDTNEPVTTTSGVTHGRALLDPLPPGEEPEILDRNQRLRRPTPGGAEYPCKCNAQMEPRTDTQVLFDSQGQPLLPFDRDQLIDTLSGLLGHDCRHLPDSELRDMFTAICEQHRTQIEGMMTPDHTQTTVLTNQVALKSLHNDSTI